MNTEQLLRDALRRAVNALDALTDLIDGTGFSDADEFSNALDEIDLGRATLSRPAQTAPAEGGDAGAQRVYETIVHWDEGGGKRSRRELARRIVALYTTPPASQERAAQCGMSEVDRADDDALRFACRVLESDAPEQSRQEALSMLRAIRIRVRKATNAQQPAPAVQAVPDEVLKEIAAALALFPADLVAQTFRVSGYAGLLEADDDTQFYSKKKVCALLEKLYGHLTAAATPRAAMLSASPAAKEGGE